MNQPNPHPQASEGTKPPTHQPPNLPAQTVKPLSNDAELIATLREIHDYFNTVRAAQAQNKQQIAKQQNTKHYRQTCASLRDRTTIDKEQQWCDRQAIDWIMAPCYRSNGFSYAGFASPDHPEQWLDRVFAEMARVLLAEHRGLLIHSKEGRELLSMFGRTGNGWF